MTNLINKDELNIVLVGMPGAGKTFVGNKLAKLLAHFTYVDTDEIIEKETGMSIAEIFEENSEKYFRIIESQVIKDLSEKRNQIISIGGGAFNNDENVRLLKKNSLVFYLRAPIEELLSRIKNETHRPLLNDENPKLKLKTLLKKREKNFLKANFIIDTYKQPTYHILDKLIGEYENYAKQISLR